MAAVLKLDRPLEQITSILRGKDPDPRFNNFQPCDAQDFTMRILPVGSTSSDSAALFASVAAHIYSKHKQYDNAIFCYEIAARILLNGHHYELWTQASRMQARHLKHMGQVKRAADIESMADRYKHTIDKAKRSRKERDYASALHYFSLAFEMLPSSYSKERDYLSERIGSMKEKMDSSYQGQLTNFQNQSSSASFSQAQPNLESRIDDLDETPEERDLRLKAQEINKKCEEDVSYFTSYNGRVPKDRRRDGRSKRNNARRSF